MAVLFAVIPEEVTAFLAPEPEDAQRWQELARVHLPVVVSMVRAYTRGRGFGGQSSYICEEDLRHVIISATARLVQNPRLMTEDSVAIDDASFTRRLTAFTGWTLPELAILNRYRKRAM